MASRALLVNAAFRLSLFSLSSYRSHVVDVCFFRYNTSPAASYVPSALLCNQLCLRTGTGCGTAGSSALAVARLHLYSSAAHIFAIQLP
jgi:hypothetical protein